VLPVYLKFVKESLKMQRKKLLAHLNGFFYSLVIVYFSVNTSLIFAKDYPYGLPSSSPDRLGVSSERIGRITSVMGKYVENKTVPGLTAIVARNGKLVYSKSFGFSNEEDQKPLEEGAIYRMYSMTKPVTAVAVMTLFEEGLILLDDPISNYLPEFKNSKVYIELEGGAFELVEAEPITIKHLLTHTSGMDSRRSQTPTGKMQLEAGLDWDQAMGSGMNLEEFVKKLAAIPLYSQPGTEWRYSYNQSVLGRLVEVVSGQPFGVYLEQKIYQPLKMTSAGFSVPFKNKERLTTLYTRNTDDSYSPMLNVPATQIDFLSRPVDLELGDGGLLCSAGDYLRFLQMLLNGGVLDGTRILSPTSVDMIMSNQLPSETKSTLRNSGLGYGFAGAVIEDVSKTNMPGSSDQYLWGGWAGTRFWIDREYQLIGMVLTQVRPGFETKPSLGDKMKQMTYQAIVK